MKSLNHGKSEEIKMKENNLSFEQSIKELEDIVKKLEDGELTLEESMRLFERGVALSNLCSKMLDDVEQKVRMLIKDKNGEMIEQDFHSSQEEEPDEL